MRLRTLSAEEQLAIESRSFEDGDSIRRPRYLPSHCACALLCVDPDGNFENRLLETYDAGGAWPLFDAKTGRALSVDDRPVLWHPDEHVDQAAVDLFYARQLPPGWRLATAEERKRHTW